MAQYDFDIPVTFRHRIRFTKDAFASGNPVVRDLFEADRSCRVLVYVESEIVRHFPGLKEQLTSYLEAIAGVTLTEIVEMAGGEVCKISKTQIMDCISPIERNKIDRHSYVFCIGGGAFLDVIGLAAATAHRGVRLVRFPTTTLSQDDSGVGVKNGINGFGKKNFIGSFAVPYAVVNDFQFLYTQPEDACRGGLVEAVKVALVKDSAFFGWMEENTEGLRKLEPAVLEEAVERSAILHARHIALGGDPFETGSSRPLDYGHWSAHKLEQLTNFSLSHAEAVSVGVALDTLYASRQGWLTAEESERVLAVLQGLLLPVWHESLDLRDAGGRREVFNGLEEFREHLGGRLTVLMLKGLGEGFDVHELDESCLDECMEELRERSTAQLPV
ncbi:MAG: 3-dehydroquinate synthase [Verrucomicrobia bacterium]|nr:3-dehydroquinate synthase [Verrucomicrobiota bacterium]MDA1005882.1 3-dehydroquinate synthase [Verrucomicrobiota bacterium]